MNNPELQAWVGREESQEDILDLARAQRMLALLDRPPSELGVADALPNGWHWLYGHTIVPRSEWGEDGHARRGGFLPPIAESRRMWAGGSLRFLQPLRLGESIQRRSVVSAIEEKEGRSGRFLLVRVSHRISGPNGLAINEQQNLVYLPSSAPSAQASPAGLAEQPDWRDCFLPDEATLFFFSALTMNGHRIHYDYRYATEVEGYPGLLVHAPLTALLLLDAARQHRQAAVTALTYRAVAPLFCGQPITLAGTWREHEANTSLWALRHDGAVAMEAVVHVNHASHH